MGLALSSRADDFFALSGAYAPASTNLKPGTLLDGLYVELPPWGSHLFSIGAAATATARQEEP